MRFIWDRSGRSVGPAETAWVQLTAGDLAGPLIEGGAGLGAGFDEVAGRPALTSGGFAANGAAARTVEHEIAGVGFTKGVDDEAVLVGFDPGEIARVVVFEDAHAARSPLCLKRSSAVISRTRGMAIPRE